MMCRSLLSGERLWSEASVVPSDEMIKLSVMLCLHVARIARTWGHTMSTVEY